MSLVKAFEWRYATKKYDTSRKVSAAQLEDLMETVRLAPSSFGLQPYKFLIIQDEAILEKISRAAHGQPQITTGSHVMVLAVKEKNLTSALLYVIGYHAGDDEYAAIPKVRKLKEEIFQTI